MTLPKGSWPSLYKPPIEKQTADLQWRIVDGLRATFFILLCLYMLLKREQIRKPLRATYLVLLSYLTG